MAMPDHEKDFIIRPFCQLKQVGEYPEVAVIPGRQIVCPGILPGGGIFETADEIVAMK